VRNVVRLLVTGGVLFLALASCDVLFMGYFPASVAQTTALTDLSGSIDPVDASSFSLSTLTAGGIEYVLLFSDLTFDSSRAHLFVLDPQLNVLQSFSNDLLFSLVATFLTGKAAMTEAADKVAIGNLIFDPVSTGLSNPTGNPAVVLSDPSTGLQPYDAYNETNYHAGGGLFQWDEYDQLWGGHIPYSVQLGTPSPPPQSTIRIVRIFNDQDSIASHLVYAFRDDGSERTYFLRIPRLDLHNDLSVVGVSGVLGYYPAIVKENLASESIGISRQGVVAYDHSSNSIIHFSLDSPGKVDSLSVRRTDHMQLAAGNDGTYCVAWDPDTRILTRYEQWW
jgi:hypothetical protein